MNKGRAAKLEDEVGSIADRVSAGVQDAAGEVAAQSAKLGRRAYAKGAYAGGRLRSGVGEQPLLALAAACAFGFVLGLLFSRR